MWSAYEAVSAVAMAQSDPFREIRTGVARGSYGLWVREKHPIDSEDCQTFPMDFDVSGAGQAPSAGAASASGSASSAGAPSERVLSHWVQRPPSTILATVTTYSNSSGWFHME